MIALGSTVTAQAPSSSSNPSQITQNAITPPSTRGPTTPVPTLRKMQAETPSSSATAASSGGMVNKLPSGGALGALF